MLSCNINFCYFKYQKDINMFIRTLLFTCMFFSNIFPTELPQYVLIHDVLEEVEMSQLQQLTENTQPNLLWYGRYNFFKESFAANIDKSNDNIEFTHFNHHPCNVITDKLAQIFLTKVQEFGEDSKKRIVLEVYLDRNMVTLESSSSSGMFWHRDSIVVDGKKQIADFTMILLINGKIQNWNGADIVLQLGGQYAEDAGYTWINSSFPKVMTPICYNQALIFKNSNTGHMVTPLIPLDNLPVHRDVFIITGYFV